MRPIAAGCGLFLALMTVDPANAQTEQKGLSLSELRRSLPIVDQIRDIRDWVGPRPSPIPEFSWSNTRQFDMQLHESLRANFDLVSVSTNGAFRREDSPERLRRWLEAVRNSDGTVRTCLEESNTKGFFALIQLLFRGFEAYRAWRLYHPATRMDAMLLVNRDGGKVRNVLFAPRGTLVACPAGFVHIPD